MEDHTYSLFDIYGPEYADLIEDIPNPIEAPTKMLQDFRVAFETLGVWCAERAALILIIKIEKLKTCEKYERHFLLLSTIYTEMIRIQKLCDIAFGDMTETEKMMSFATPKLLKLVEVFKEYKPEHIKKNVAKDNKSDSQIKLSDKTASSSSETKDANNSTVKSEEKEQESDSLNENKEFCETDVKHEKMMDSSSKDIHVKDNVIHGDNKDVEDMNRDMESNITGENEDSKIISPDIDSINVPTIEIEEIVENSDQCDADNCNGEPIVEKKIASRKEKSTCEQDKPNRKTHTKASSRHATQRSSTESPHRNPRGKSSTNSYSSYNDPDALCGVVFMENKFVAKIIYHFLKDLSRCDVTYSFLTPQYAVDTTGDIADKGDYENEDGTVRKQEEALRRFRMRECNLLVTNSLLEIGVDNVRCNLVVAFDKPSSFKSYVQYKVKAKAQNSLFLLMCDDNEDALNKLMNDLAFYQVIENKLKNKCNFQGPNTTRCEPSRKLDNHNHVSLPILDSNHVPKRSRKVSPGLKKELSSNNEIKFRIDKSILYLNRYCAKLPSDTFTRLSPLYDIFEVSENRFSCAIQLPINSPLKEVILGPTMKSRDLSIVAAALKVCLKLQSMRELDEYMLPIGKDASSGSHYYPKISQPKNSSSKSSSNTSSTNTKTSLILPINTSSNADTFRDARPGTTKRRQYYYKQVASCLRLESMSASKEDEKEKLIDIKNQPEVSNKKKDCDEQDDGLQSNATTYFLYSLHLKLTCAIPEDQNTRGRKINDPEDSSQKFGILVKDEMPPVSEFPIYTRSGEVFVTTKMLSDNIKLTEEKKRMVLKFHDYTFSKVLRLVKYPMMFSPEKSENAIIVLPLKVKKDSQKKEQIEEDIDWEFLNKIEKESNTKLTPLSDHDRKDFDFVESQYSDAVIMPWYRNQDQPQYFYVAEICSHLSPTSDFPGQGFESFEKYYLEKYQIQIQNSSQPLLDVDHTSARLNFLTPRYVNRKGVALPTSSEETKKSKRENLDQKQILVPELCAIHPFPASLWRQTVCLPCILYRLNGLLIANQLRSIVALDTRLCKTNLPRNHEWPALTFGWTLKDVLMNRTAQPIINNNNSKSIPNSIKASQSKNSNLENSNHHEFVGNGDDKNDDELGCLTNQLLNKLNEEDSKVKGKSSLDIGTWSNDMINNTKTNERQRNEMTMDEEMDEFEEMEQLFGGPDVALPDNLTILDTSILPLRSNGGTDWGTGIAQRPFRVGSPTFFSNPNINIPGVMDDYDRFSCSDVSDMDNMDDFDDQELRDRSMSSKYNNQDPKEGEDVGNMRIEFHGDNMAEAVENEIAKKKRNETLAKDLEEESEMVTNLPWQWNKFDIGSTEDLRELTESMKKLILSQSNIILECEDNFSKNKLKQSNLDDSSNEYNELHALLNDKDSCEDDNDTKLLVKDFERQLTVIPNDNQDENVMYEKDHLADKGVIPWESDNDFTFSFDLQPALLDHTGPSPNLILQSLTMSNSNDAINLERLIFFKMDSNMIFQSLFFTTNLYISLNKIYLFSYKSRLETIGDSFLKYATTAYLFIFNSSVHEGRLSHLRSKYVSNLNLYKLGKRKGLGQFMIATKFEPHDNWLPPCYYVPKEIGKIENFLVSYLHL